MADSLYASVRHQVSLALRQTWGQFDEAGQVTRLDNAQSDEAAILKVTYSYPDQGHPDLALPTVEVEIELTSEGPRHQAETVTLDIRWTVAGGGKPLWRINNSCQTVFTADNLEFANNLACLALQGIRPDGLQMSMKPRVQPLNWGWVGRLNW